MQPFLPMMVDSGAQFFEIAARHCVGRGLARISPAKLAIDVRQQLATEEVGNPSNTASAVIWPRMLIHHVVKIDRQDIGNRYLSRIALAYVAVMLLRDVFGKYPFGLFGLVNAASSRDLAASIKDNVDGPMMFTVSVVATGPEPQARTFGATWHLSLICLIAASVV
jgi:hypothetical protein